MGSEEKKRPKHEYRDEPRGVVVIQRRMFNAAALSLSLFFDHQVLPRCLDPCECSLLSSVVSKCGLRILVKWS
jgi:hypothetical protein